MSTMNEKQECEFCGYEVETPEGFERTGGRLIVCRRCRKAAIEDVREAARFGVELDYEVFERVPTKVTDLFDAGAERVDFDAIASAVMAECYNRGKDDVRAFDTDPED